MQTSWSVARGKLGAEDVQHAAWITRTPVRDCTFVDQLPETSLGEW